MLQDRRGNIALKFALVAPVVVLLTVGSIELASVRADQQRLQGVADSAALAGANELHLGVASSAPIERARAFVAAQLASLPRPPKATVGVAVVERGSGGRGLRVEIAAKRMSFFGNMLPPGGWDIGVQATASSMGMAPLCVLGHGQGVGDALKMEGSAQLKSPACMVQSNDRIKVAASSRIFAAITQSVGRATGQIQPAAQTGAPPIADPYLDMKITVPGACTSSKVVKVDKSRSLAPGIHCDDYVVSGKNVVLTLQAGDHYFVNSRLEMKSDSTLAGQDVALVFDRSSFDFLDKSQVTLGGRRSGSLAGFVIVGLRPKTAWCKPKPGAEDDDDDEDDDDEDDDDDDDGPPKPSRPKDCRLGSEFKMASDNVKALNGVIYMPSSKLIVEGKNQVAGTSDWTVMITEQLEIRGSPILVINADYSGSLVPVPDGVGWRSSAVRLVG
ncbi:TadE/TadG family type IV pilus assembly protein [Brevundimonas sp. PAMC22021]|uniref:TadE/TadG family type IV pilus assembly protein n=1 Tax=Brevundimonas sp. PAMC22021 TaxID=2861285 RepID=UPI001C62DC5F|nr:TadE/TadG family type IV pilus assembly protein [Brevundimonas sp. PAMC22021]QYF87032.1 pilus assembly protein [Brevundimonas sp. PAMC22021]